MRIVWVNHASFVLEVGKVRLMSDPWLEGWAFDHGCALLSQTRFAPSDWADITHVWFSHEHPDHFSPYTLGRVPLEHRQRITVLYQTARDGKVPRECRELGFKQVIELPPGRWTTVAAGLEVLCQPYEGCDSWFAARAGGQTVVNLNDCRVDTPAKARTVRRKVGSPIDVLFTQFSDAQWEGRREAAAVVKAKADARLAWIATQTIALAPKAVVPCASFLWYCHEENQDLNALGNRIDAAAHLLSGLPTQTVVLYPGDEWDVGAQHDPRPAIERYLTDHSQTLGAPRLSAPRVGEQRLQEDAADFYARLRRNNGPLARWFLVWARRRPSRIHVRDLGQSYDLDDRGLRRTTTAPEDCDVLLGSSALAYSLRHPWGGETLAINGRYRAGKGDPQAFFLPLRLATANNHGRQLAAIPFLRLRDRLRRLARTY